MLLLLLLSTFCVQCLTNYHSFAYLNLRKILFSYKNCCYFYFVVARDAKLCHKETKILSEKRQIPKDGICRKDPSIEDVFVCYKLEKKKKKKKKKKTNSFSSLQPLPPKLRRKPRQPRSQGSLLPALRRTPLQRGKTHCAWAQNLTAGQLYRSAFYFRSSI